MTAADDPDSVRELLEELARTLVRWSYEGTDASEFAIAEIARAYGVNAEVTFLAESAFLRLRFGMMTGFALIPRRLRVWDRMVG